ncbi:hypothetical protein IQ249_12220 [Lusitaniella coriacea LEGE 07157]|uniref:Uncharacterized protein n=1 Tax=Lusitaniella coriacea LEGE 07157 TaxID=945747 RepID=A0A8J7DX06_9CYAN|nr:hypothetical protein [Lusitaniella coriacea]MBE9116667.1 hypothetical protein [Lusitaniella coriacea LEGE 07157]
MDLRTERIESLKVGAIGGFAFCIADIVARLANAQIPIDLDSLPRFAGIEGLIGGAIAIASGFLFGVTYRYIVRSDDNSHLRDGAVLAFGLVRGLAPIAAQSALALDWGSSIIFGVESLLCYLIARLALDLAFRNQWVQPMK